MREKKTVWCCLVFAREAVFAEATDDKIKATRFFWTVYLQNCRSTGNTLGRGNRRYAGSGKQTLRKSDYILYFLGRNARFAANFEVGSRVQIWGRIQSREYVKDWKTTGRKNGPPMKYPSANWKRSADSSGKQ